MFFSSVLLLVLSIAIYIPAIAAASHEQVIYLPQNQSWVTAGMDTRTGLFSYVKARNHSVYPNSGIDLFTTIQCKITDANGTLLCNESYYTLTETANDYTQIRIKEGCLKHSDIYFCFRGNTSAEATAIVSYNAM